MVTGIQDAAVTIVVTRKKKNWQKNQNKNNNWQQNNWAQNNHRFQGNIGSTSRFPPTPSPFTHFHSNQRNVQGPPVRPNQQNHTPFQN